MPYHIEVAQRGFKVCDTKGKCFSKNPLTEQMARKQRIAIALSENRKTGKPLKKLFA